MKNIFAAFISFVGFSIFAQHSFKDENGKYGIKDENGDVIFP